MIWKLFVITLCTIFSVTYSIEVERCDDKIPGAVDFVAEGCDKFPCPLVRGTDSNVNITFNVPYDLDTSTIKIEAKVVFWIPFSPKDSNTCHNLLNSYCPLDQNEIVTYHLAIPIVKLYPKLKMTLKIQFLDPEKNSVMCILVPCAVVDPK